MQKLITIKKLLAIFIVLFSIFMLSGCGGDTNSSEGSTADFDLTTMEYKAIDELLTKDFKKDSSNEGKTVCIEGPYARGLVNGAYIPRVDISQEGSPTINGLNFYVEGWTEENYPQINQIVKVTGVFAQPGDRFNSESGNPMSSDLVILVNPEDVIIN